MKIASRYAKAVARFTVFVRVVASVREVLVQAVKTRDVYERNSQPSPSHFHLLVLLLNRANAVRQEEL